jgi:3-oxoacyl-[acyl-carrier protein] reductase
MARAVVAALKKGGIVVVSTDVTGAPVRNSVHFDFTGASVAITGGTSGIGHATATAFRDAGAEVTVTGTRPAPADYDTDLSGFSYHQVQMREPSTIDAFTASLERLDVLVNNAGANFPDGRDEWEPDAFASALVLNLAGPMRCSTGCRRLLADSDLDGGGSIVNLVSMSAFRPVPIVPGYGAAKAGLASLTANMAKHWYRKGIRVNAVAPGVIDTPMTAPMAAFPELLDAELSHTAMGRLGRIDEIVGAVQFLASSAASFITGTTLVVDGGYQLY